MTEREAENDKHAQHFLGCGNYNPRPEDWQGSDYDWAKLPLKLKSKARKATKKAGKAATAAAAAAAAPATAAAGGRTASLPVGRFPATAAAAAAGKKLNRIVNNLGTLLRNMERTAVEINKALRYADKKKWKKSKTFVSKYDTRFVSVLFYKVKRYVRAARAHLRDLPIFVILTPLCFLFLSLFLLFSLSTQGHCLERTTRQVDAHHDAQVGGQGRDEHP